MTINEKPWRRAREVYRALKYGKATRITDIVKRLCSKENYTQKYRLAGFVSETRPRKLAKRFAKIQYLHQ